MITGNTTENSFIDWLIVASKLQSAAQLTRSTRREKTPWLAILKLIIAWGNITKLNLQQLLNFFSSRFDLIRFGLSDAAYK